MTEKRTTEERLALLERRQELLYKFARDEMSLEMLKILWNRAALEGQMELTDPPEKNHKM